MITHKTFTEHLNRIFTKAVLAKEIKQHIEAREILSYAIQEIEIHSRHTITKPPALLKLERDIFREAFFNLNREFV